MEEHTRGRPSRESYDESSAGLESRASVTECSRRTSFADLSFQQQSSFSELNEIQYESLSKEDEEPSNTLHSSYGFSFIEELVESCFCKKFSFTRSSGPIRCTSMKKSEPQVYRTELWNRQLDEFQELKKKLNRVKGKLNNYDLNEWHRHTRSTNPADLVMRRVRNEINGEFVTQAWCKFYELMTEFRLIPDEVLDSRLLCTVHLCEAPGAFIASLNHYLKSHSPDVEWDWFANSLNPYYEGNAPTQMINDDRFVLETIQHWDFGPDMTGDITQPGYSDHLYHKCDNDLPHLVTADGSFDCQDRAGEQEGCVSWLLLKETLTALKILRRGGNFVMKMFTFFECNTICLLYLLNNAFKSVNVMKPVTSKEGNSEVYVVCREFKGGDTVKLYLKSLVSITLEQHQNFAMFPYEEVNRDFIYEVLNCAKQFATYQIRTIERNIELFHDCNNLQIKKQLKLVQEKLWQKFIQTYRVKPIAHSLRIIPFKNQSLKNRKRFTVTENREARAGSYADRLKENSLDVTKVVDQISTELNELGMYCLIEETRMPEINVEIEHFHVVACKPFSRIMSSQFCHGAFIRMKNQLLDTISAANYFTFLANNPRNFQYDCKICDFRPVYMQSINNNDVQIIVFQEICNTLAELRDGENLGLIDFSLLTQFNVNILVFLAQIFKKIEFKDTRVLYLHSFDAGEYKKWKTKLEEILQLYSETCSILSFFPLWYITGMKNSLYLWLLQINNARAYSEIMMLIESNFGTVDTRREDGSTVHTGLFSDQHMQLHQPKFNKFSKFWGPEK